MNQDNPGTPEETRLPQARSLARQALAAERAGDMATAERLFAEAERIDPVEVAEELAEANRAAAEPPGLAPSR